MFDMLANPVLSKTNLNILSTIRITIQGQPPWHSGLVLPAAHGVILETLDRVPRQALCMEPASPSAYVCLSLCISMNKYIKTLKNEIKYFFKKEKEGAFIRVDFI